MALEKQAVAAAMKRKAVVIVWVRGAMEVVLVIVPMEEAKAK